MSDSKKYLFPSGGTHVLGVILLIGFVGVMTYDLLFGVRAMLRECNVYVPALMLLFMLVYIAMLEACMMILAKGFLFAYNVDKAMCLPILNGNLKDAVLQGRKMYGPIFDKDCERLFSSNPCSTLTRKCFYWLAVLMFVLSLVPPICQSVAVEHQGALTARLVGAWFFVVLDFFLIVNRILYRASLRKFWAMTLGDSYYREILGFELGDVDCPSSASTIMGCDNGLHKKRASDPNMRMSSRRKEILMGVALVVVIVFAMNSCQGRKNRKPMAHDSHALIHDD